MIKCVPLVKPFRYSSALLTGVRASSVPLINNTGTFDFKGDRNSSPRSGAFHSSHTPGNGKLDKSSSKVPFASRPICSRRAAVCPEAQSIMYDIADPIPWREMFNHTCAGFRSEERRVGKDG